MKKAPLVLAIFGLCVMLLMFAFHTEVDASSPTPTLDPGIFSLNDATTYQAPDGLFSIKVPKSWQQTFDASSNTYSFSAASPNASQVVLDVQYTTLAGFARDTGLTTVLATPRDLVDGVKKRIASVSGNTASVLYSARIGSLLGFGATLTITRPTPQVADLRVAEIAKDKIVVVLAYSATPAWPYAKPVFDRAVLSLNINPQRFPTIAPTPTITPTPTASTLTLAPSSFDDIHQIMGPDGAPAVGDPSASITLEEFLDFSCPHCLDYQPVMVQVLDKYVRSGKVRIIFRFMTFVGDNYSVVAAKAAICAAQQGHYLEMQQALFSVQEQLGYESFTADTIQDVASRLKLDIGLLTRCEQEPSTAAAIEYDQTVADKLGVNAVPWVLYSKDGKKFNTVTDPVTGNAKGVLSLDDIARIVAGTIEPGSPVS